MATIAWTCGDRFSFNGGYGIMFRKGALLFKGEGGRTGRTISRGDVPPDAIPISADALKNVPYDVKFAMDAVAATFG